MKFTFLFVAVSLSINALSQNITFNTVDTGRKENLIFPGSKKFNLKKIVADIATYPSVDGSMVGYIGARTEQYERYMELSLNASEEELVKLTDHLSANVKAYAFQCLAARKSSQVKVIFEKHIRDHQTFLFRNTCFFINYNINNWFLECVAPLLTIEEEKNYKLQIQSSGTN